MAQNDQLVVQMNLPLAGLECSEIRCYDAGGKLMSLVARIEIVPSFIRKDAAPPVLYARTIVQRDGREVREVGRSILGVSGSTGDLRLRGFQTENVVPGCLQDGEESPEENGEQGDESHGAGGSQGSR